MLSRLTDHSLVIIVVSSADRGDDRSPSSQPHHRITWQPFLAVSGKVCGCQSGKEDKCSSSDSDFGIGSDVRLDLCSPYPQVAVLAILARPVFEETITQPKGLSHAQREIFPHLANRRHAGAGDRCRTGSSV